MDRGLALRIIGENSHRQSFGIGREYGFGQTLFPRDTLVFHGRSGLEQLAATAPVTWTAKRRPSSWLRLNELSLEGSTDRVSLRESRLKCFGTSSAQCTSV